jgi:hypothetical protein
MDEISSRTFGELPGECPICKKVAIDFSSVVGDPSEIVCAACGALLWSIRIDDGFFIFDRRQMSLEEWNDVLANLPCSGDDGTIRVEKILIFEALSTSSFTIDS